MPGTGPSAAGPSGPTRAPREGRWRRFSLARLLQRAPSQRRGVRRLVALVLLSVFVADLLVRNGVVGLCVLYIVPVLLSLWGTSRRTTLLVAALGTVLTVAGVFLPLAPPRTILLPLLVSRSVAVFAIWVTARLGLLRKGIEEELTHSREVTATTLASIADAVITTDPEGRVTFLNAAASVLTGYSAELARGRRLGEVFRRSDRGPSERALPPVEELADIAGEAELLTRDGRRIPVETSSAQIDPVEGSDGGSLGRVLVFRDVTQRKLAQERVEELAFRDGLTGLANRVSFLDRLELELAHEKRRRGCLALLYVDLDGFKDVNDTHGHGVGDKLLIEVGRRLTSALRAGDTIARMGGDEFTVVLPDVGGPESAAGVVEKLLERLILPYLLDGLELLAPPSIGVALYPRDGRDVDELLRHADRAMYRAKNAGGARIAGLDAERSRSRP